MKLKQIHQLIVRGVQKTLGIVLLGGLYIFGFGIAFVLAGIFYRSLFVKKWERDDSFWITASHGYEPDGQEAQRQS